MVRNRPPLILIPSILGTRLVNGKGGERWDTTLDLYFGPNVSGAPEVTPQGLLEQFTLVPGLLSYDIYGGLVRFLEHIGGYRRNEDLFVLDYDWRTGIVDGAAKLHSLVQRIRGIGDEKVDLLGISTGGLIARYFLAHGGADVLADGNATPTGLGAACTRRVVYVGTPQRGSFHVFEMLVQGVRPAPLGKHFSGDDIARLQTAWDCLPHPNERVFIDDEGKSLELNLYEPEVWRRFRLLALREPDLVRKLDRARRLHEALDRPFVHRDAFVIAGRNRPTTVRARVSHGKLKLAPCEPQRNDRYADHMYQPGDNSVPAASARALPGIAEERLWWCKPTAHHLLPADRSVQRLVVEALLATARPIPVTSLRVLDPQSHADG
jgi:pimeloyl-ACP methyl ester carboxylesterase